MVQTHCSLAALSEQHPVNIRCTGTPIMMQASVPQLQLARQEACIRSESGKNQTASQVKPSHQSGIFGVHTEDTFLLALEGSVYQFHRIV